MHVADSKVATTSDITDLSLSNVLLLTRSLSLPARMPSGMTFWKSQRHDLTLRIQVFGCENIAPDIFGNIFPFSLQHRSRNTLVDNPIDALPLAKQYTDPLVGHFRCRNNNSDCTNKHEGIR